MDEAEIARLAMAWPCADADLRVPLACPVCDAPLKAHWNEKGKYREFRYACGAGGFYDETRSDRDGSIDFTTEPDLGDIECPNATRIAIELKRKLNEPDGRQ